MRVLIPKKPGVLRFGVVPAPVKRCGYLCTFQVCRKPWERESRVVKDLVHPFSDLNSLVDH